MIMYNNCCIVCSEMQARSEAEMKLRQLKYELMSANTQLEQVYLLIYNLIQNLVFSDTACLLCAMLVM